MPMASAFPRPKTSLFPRSWRPDVAFIRDELPVTVRVRSQGMQGQRGRLELMLDGTQVDDKEVTF